MKAEKIIKENPAVVKLASHAVILIVAGILVYFIIRKFFDNANGNAQGTGNTADQLNTLNGVKVDTNQLSYPIARYQLDADTVYDNLNAWWITSGGYESDIYNICAGYSSPDDLAQLVKSFGTRASTIAALPGIAAPVTSKMTLPQWFDYKLDSDYKQKMKDLFSLTGLY